MSQYFFSGAIALKSKLPSEDGVSLFLHTTKDFVRSANRSQLQVRKDEEVEQHETRQADE